MIRTLVPDFLDFLIFLAIQARSWNWLIQILHFSSLDCNNRKAKKELHTAELEFCPKIKFSQTS